MELWNLRGTEAVGGHDTEIVGKPKLIETDAGPAVEFDGLGDALVVKSNPLAGNEAFTIEVTFQPYSGGAAEQRFFHIQEEGSQNRLLFETRLTARDEWILDAFIQVGETGYVHFDENITHAIGPWYHVAIVVGDGWFRNYTNGELEMESKISFVPQTQGQTSIGVRLNRAYWYKGAMRTVRFSPEPLVPAAFACTDMGGSPGSMIQPSHARCSRPPHRS